MWPRTVLFHKVFLKVRKGIGSLLQNPVAQDNASLTRCYKTFVYIMGFNVAFWSGVADVVDQVKQSFTRSKCVQKYHAHSLCEASILPYELIIEFVFRRVICVSSDSVCFNVMPIAVGMIMVALLIQTRRVELCI